MKRSIRLSMLIMAVLLLPWLRVSQADNQEIVMLDGPRGAWLATVRGDLSMEVLEEHDGWRRVRLEGWIAGAESGGSAPAAAGAAAGAASQSAEREIESGTAAQGSAVIGVAGVAASPQDEKAAEVAPPPSAPRVVTVSGVLLPTVSDQSATPGAGLVVLLVGELKLLEEEHARAGRECLDALEVSQREIDARKKKYSMEMNASDNFKEAAQRNDRAEKAVKQAELEHRERIDDCRRAADQLFQKHAIRKAISDLAGRFEFDEVPPGEFRVVASEIGGEAPRAWVLDCPVTGNMPIVLDPRTDRSSMQPYWGLDRSDGSS